MRLRNRLPMGVLASILALPLVACSGDNTELARPALGIQKGGGGPPQAEPEIEYVIVSMQNQLQSLVDDYALNLIDLVEDVALVSATSSDLQALALDARLSLMGPNTIYDGSDIINIMVGFVETGGVNIQENESIDIVQPITPITPGHHVEDRLLCMNLDAVHQVATGAGMKIVLIDTGADRYHADLVGKIMTTAYNPFLNSPHESSPNGDDDDGDGQVDEGFGHGTFMAGIFARVAPDAKIYPFAALNDDGAGTAYQIAVALKAARKIHPDVVNLSFRLDTSHDVIAYYANQLVGDGAVVVAAGGNTAGGSATYPATLPSVLGVAAAKYCDGTMANFSALDGSLLSLAALGEQVIAAYPGASPGGTQLAYAHGTSTAAAVVSAAVALVKSAGYEDPVKRLQFTTTPVTPSGSVTFGIIDLVSAVGATP